MSETFVHKKRPASHRRRRNRRLALALLACMLLSAAVFGSTLAYILADTPAISNRFEKPVLSCEVLEDFTDGTVKKDVCIQNTGNTAAYIRVKLLPYWYDKEADTIIAKSAWQPAFTPGEGWVRGTDGFFYYTTPVMPGASTGVLIPSVTLAQDEVSLARQVLEILASCIQAEPEGAVLEAWSGTNGSVTGIASGRLQIAQGG